MNDLKIEEDSVSEVSRLNNADYLINMSEEKKQFGDRLSYATDAPVLQNRDSPSPKF